MLRLSGRSIAAPEIEKRAADSVRRSLAGAGPAVVKPYTGWLTEDYYIIQLRRVMTSDSCRVTAEELIAEHGDEIAQVVRGA